MKMLLHYKMPKLVQYRFIEGIFLRFLESVERMFETGEQEASIL